MKWLMCGFLLVIALQPSKLPAAQKLRLSQQARNKLIAIGYVVCSGNKSDSQRGMKAIDTIRTELRKSHIRALFDGSRTYDILVPTRDRDKAKGIVLKLIIKDKLPAKLYKD